MIAPRAKFNARFRELGAEVIEHDFADTEDAIRVASQAGPFDLVHAHPFQARIVGAAIARKFQSKLFLTIHGQYLDAIDDSFDCIICVSERIADYIRANTDIDGEKVHVIPNAVDTQSFHPQKAFALRKFFKKATTVTVCSRIDPDKEVLFRCIKDTAHYLTSWKKSIQLCIQGENFYGDVQEFINSVMAQPANTRLVIRNDPWCDDRRKLCQIFNASDIVIASGRAAAESLACLRPTIAVASRGYVGLLDDNSIELGIATNFGGCYEPATRYSPERLFADIERATSLSSRALRSTRERLLNTNSHKVVAHDQRKLAQKALEQTGR